MTKKTVVAGDRAVSSRGAVEKAIEMSKDGRGASWERPNRVLCPRRAHDG